MTAGAAFFDSLCWQHRCIDSIGAVWKAVAADEDIDR